MNIGAISTVALSALARNKMRSLLTTLGVVIGVAAVIIMQGMGQGATQYVGDAISGMGTNMLLVVPGTSHGMGGSSLGVPLFTTGDLDAIRHGAPAVALAAGANSRFMRTVVGANNRITNVGGVSPEYFSIRQWGVDEGRLFGEEDERGAALVCLIGHTAADQLFGTQEFLGREVRVHDLSCRVVGRLEARGATFGLDQDDCLFLPNSTFSRRIAGTERVGIIFASATSKDGIDTAKDQITSILRHRRHILQGEDDDFSVRDPRDMQALLQTVTGTLSTLLAGVAAISLLVGGIGIMNIMLVSVTERTREVGIRLAVGARSSDILRQFLVESVVLSAAGGMIGIVVGVAGAWGVARGLKLPFAIPAFAAPIAFAVSLFVGVVFGVFPARKASRLNPLAALRYE
ncbi:MAG TPA: ABC transporter permease [bacterium]|nr:ABC transporter permease [bacterium]